MSHSSWKRLFMRDERSVGKKFRIEEPLHENTTTGFLSRAKHMAGCAMLGLTLATGMMADAGCKAIKFGVESACQSTVDWLNKKLDLDAVRKATHLCQSLGMHVHHTFCYGFSVEKADEAKKAISDWVSTVRPDSIQVSDVRAYDGTPLGNEVVDEPLVLHPWEV